MAYQDIIRIVPTAQSLSLLRSVVPSKKKKKKGMTKSAVEIIVGTSLIKETAKFT